MIKQILLTLIVIGLVSSASLYADISSIKTMGSSSNPVIMNCNQEGDGPYMLIVTLRVENPTDERQDVNYAIKDTRTNEWVDQGFLCSVGSSLKECTAYVPIYLGGTGEGEFDQEVLKVYIDDGETEYSKIFSFSFEHVETPGEKNIRDKKQILEQRLSNYDLDLEVRCPIVDILDSLDDYQVVDQMIKDCELQDAYNEMLKRINIVNDAEKPYQICLDLNNKYQELKEICDQGTANKFKEDIEKGKATLAEYNMLKEQCSNGEQIEEQEQEQQTTNNQEQEQKNEQTNNLCASAAILAGVVALYMKKI